MKIQDQNVLYSLIAIIGTYKHNRINLWYLLKSLVKVIISLSLNYHVGMRCLMCTLLQGWVGQCKHLLIKHFIVHHKPDLNQLSIHI